MLLYLAILPVGAAAYWLLRSYWRRRIERWCRGFRVELVSFRFVRPWEQGYPLDVGEKSFRIMVRDREGFVREGRLVFYAFWVASEPEVTWD